MILPSAWLSTHTSFQDDSLSFRDFDNMIYVKTHNNPNYKKEIEDAFNKKQKVIVSVSLFAKDKRYFKSLKDISNGDKFVCVDEGDFAAWTPNKRNILDYILNGDKKGKMIVLTMSGTNVARMVTGSDKIDGVVQSTYMALEQTEKDIVKRSFVKMQLSNTDEYVKKLTVNDMFSWTKVWANPYKSQNFIKHFLLGVTGNSDNINNQSYKDLNLSVMMEQPVNCLMLFGSGTKKTMAQFKEIAKKSLPTWRIEVLDSDHTSNNMAKEQITIAINEAKNQNKEGLLIISNTMGSRSFSISEIQSTMICYDKGGIDPTVQKISRSLTPGKLWNGETKKTGYIATFSIDSNRDDTAVKLLTEEAAIQSQNTKQSLPKTIKQLLRNVSILSTDEEGNRIEMVEDKLIEEMSSSKVLKKVAFALCKPENILKDKVLLNELLSMKIGNVSKTRENTQLPKGKNFASVDKKVSSKKQKSILNKLLKSIDLLIDSSSMVALESEGQTFSECVKKFDNEKFKKLFGIERDTILKVLKINGLPENLLDTIVSNTNNLINKGDYEEIHKLKTIGSFSSLGVIENDKSKDVFIKHIKKDKDYLKKTYISLGTNMGYEIAALLELGVPKKQIVIKNSDMTKLWENTSIKYYNKDEKVNKKFDKCIMNPPYGKNANLAIEMLSMAKEYADEIIAIMPKTLRKPTAFNRIDPNLHLVSDQNNPDDTFIGSNGKSLTTCTQKWVVKNTKRPKVERKTKDMVAKYFEFTTKEKGDITMCRVGRGVVGDIYEKGKDYGRKSNYEDRSSGSHYFIKVKDKKVIKQLKDLLPEFQKVSLNTVGNPSLSIDEIVTLYCEKYVG